PMSESFGDGRDASRINIEQAKAAQKAVFDAAADAVYRVEMKPATGAMVTESDRAVIRNHHGKLIGFAPELMDDRFKGEVGNLIERCNAILNAPLTDLFE